MYKSDKKREREKENELTQRRLTQAEEALRTARLLKKSPRSVEEGSEEGAKKSTIKETPTMKKKKKRAAEL